MLTIHLLTKNNEETIRACLESITSLNADIIIGDLGSDDETLNICKEYSGKIINIQTDNRSECRNNIIKISPNEWQFWIEPWEILVSGHEQLLWATTQDKEAYKVYNVQDGLISKQTRLWKKGRTFVRPIYEDLEPQKNDTLIECTLNSLPHGSFSETIEKLKEWKKKSPHTADIDYYMAYTYAIYGKYEDFLTCAEHFLFRNNDNIVDLMMHFYYARVQLLVKKNYQECIKHIVYCLSIEPTMAEFWCLLGDTFFKMKQFHRASAFYDNAIIFGSRRLSSDPYPIEISKYKEYPDKMLNLCKEVLKASLSHSQQV